MRKLRRLMALVLVFCFAALPVRAADGGIAQLSDVGLTNVFEELRPALVETVNASLEDRGLPPIVEETLDLNAFYPYYYLDDLFSADIQTAYDFYAALDTGRCQWCIPFEHAGHYLQLAVGKDDAGNWKYNSLAWGSTSSDLKEKALALGASGDHITLVGSYHGLMFAVCAAGDEITEVIALEDYYFPVYERNLEEIAKKGGFRTVGADSLEIRAGDRYSFEALQQSLGQLVQNPLNGQYAQCGLSIVFTVLGNERVLIALGGGALAAALIGCHVYRNRKER